MRKQHENRRTIGRSEREEQLAAIAPYCARLDELCPDFDVAMCENQGNVTLPSAGVCYAERVRYFMCVTSLGAENLECGSTNYSGQPKAGFCQEEYSAMLACTP